MSPVIIIKSQSFDPFTALKALDYISINEDSLQLLAFVSRALIHVEGRYKV